MQSTPVAMPDNTEIPKPPLIIVIHTTQDDLKAVGDDIETGENPLHRLASIAADDHSLWKVTASRVESLFEDQEKLRNTVKEVGERTSKSAERRQKKLREYTKECEEKMAERRHKQKSHITIMVETVDIPDAPSGWGNTIKLTSITSDVLNELWNEGEGHVKFQSFIRGLSQKPLPEKKTCPAVELRWKDDDGEIRTEIPHRKRHKHGGRLLDFISDEYTGVSGDGKTETVSHHDRFHSFAVVYVSTAIALLMHAKGDHKNFGRIVASNPGTVWGEILSFRPGPILEEESMQEIMNQIIEEIVVRNKGDDPETHRYLLRDMFEHFTEHHCALGAKPKHLSWVKRKIHNHKDASLDRIFWEESDDEKLRFQEYMQRALSLRDLGSLANNVYGAALLTAIVGSGSLRYARNLVERDKRDGERLGFYLGMLFHAARAAIGLAPVGAGAGAEMVSAMEDAVNNYLKRSDKWKPRDLTEAVAQRMIGGFYNPAIDGRKVPGLDGEAEFVHHRALLPFDAGRPADETALREAERRMEVGRHYAERAHRYLAELLPDLTLWTPLIPQTYVPPEA